MEQSIFTNSNESKKVTAKDLETTKVLFAPDVWKKAERSQLDFANDIGETKELGTAELKLIKPRPEGDPFMIVKFSKHNNRVGVMLGDIKDATGKKENSPEPLIPVKKSKKIVGYDLNSNATFSWDHENRRFMVQ